jgi:dephospho-CoA kinase
MSPARPFRVALTGGIASGKSYCRRRFESLGAPTLDADVLARDAVAAGAPGLDAVVRRFGSRVLTVEGELDRGALGALVFADQAARRDLEAIIHPIVYEGIRGWFGALAERGAPIGLADVPLLFETGHEGDFDRVIVASCRPEQQLTRVIARDGLTETAARARIASQMPLHEKAARADVVIDTSGTFDETDRQVDAAWREMVSAARRP